MPGQLRGNGSNPALRHRLCAGAEEIAGRGCATAFPDTTLTAVTGAPTSSEIQFTGTPSAPSGTTTLSAPPRWGGQLTITYVARAMAVAAPSKRHMARTLR